MLNTEEICTYFDASLAVVAINSPTSAELAVTKLLIEGVARSCNLKPYIWDLAQQLQEIGLAKNGEIDKKPAQGYKPDGHPVGYLLNFINNYPDPGLFIICDLHHFLPSGTQFNPAVLRSLINTCFNLKRSAKRMVILGQNLKLPDELEGLVVELKNPLPDAIEVAQFLELRIAALVKAAKNSKFNLPVELTATEKESLVLALQGLTYEEIDDALTLATYKLRKINAQTADEIVPIKMTKLRKRGVDYAAPPDVPIRGLPALEEWAMNQAGRLKPEAKNYNIPAPNGVLLIGYGGTGKSLFSKNLGAAWKIPILSLDMGKMMSSLLGSSEANLRIVLETADAIAPCILLIDELDKAFAGMNGAVTDSGTFQRMIGSFLQWFADKTTSVFVVATANRTNHFTPELLRRFDEIFFVDLPDATARVEIFKVHLAKRFIALEQESIEMLAASTEGYTGAEIAKIVLNCAVKSFNTGRPANVTTGEIMAEIGKRSPQAVSDAEEIEELRRWARSGGARFATDVSPTIKNEQTSLERRINWNNNN